MANLRSIKIVQAGALAAFQPDPAIDDPGGKFSSIVLCPRRVPDAIRTTVKYILRA